MTAAAPGNDSGLVSRSIAGDRNAFGQIVARYQLARDFIFAQPFFRSVYALLPFLPWMNFLWILPLFKWWRMTRKHTPSCDYKKTFSKSLSKSANL